MANHTQPSPLSDETHPLYPSIVRGPNGFWGEDVTSIDYWEVPEERRIVPGDIAEIMETQSPVARVDGDTARKQPRKHRTELAEWIAFDFVIQHWGWWRKQEPGESRTSAYERWQFISFIVDPETGEEWPLNTVLEKMPDATIRIVTSHRRKPSFARIVRESGKYAQRMEE
ncbi:MAG: hypothetical protein QM753_01995 [Thermomicrobiales bacterium]